MKLRSYKNYIFIFMGAFLLLISAFTMKVEAKEKDWKEISMKKYTRE